MVKPTYQFIAQMFAASGVIVSLGFVAYEMKQSRDIAVAELNLQQSYYAAEYFLALTDTDAWRSAEIKRQISGEELNLEERQAIATGYMPVNLGRYNNWMLAELGFGREGESSASDELLIKADMADPTYLEFWILAFSNPIGEPAWNQKLRELWVEVHGEPPPVD